MIFIFYVLDCIFFNNMIYLYLEEILYSVFYFFVLNIL